MLPQKTILEKAKTGRQYLEEKGLDASLYFLAVDGKMVRDKDAILKEGGIVQAIPIVKGG